jgi:hypothetical protein
MLETIRKQKHKYMPEPSMLCSAELQQWTYSTLHTDDPEQPYFQLGFYFLMYIEWGSSTVLKKMYLEILKDLQGFSTREYQNVVSGM